MTREKYHPSFYFTINSLFILLILGVGGILSWHNYRSTKKIVLLAADRAYDQIMGEISKDFRYTYRPVFQVVHLLSMSPIMKASTLDARLQEIGILSSVLQNQPEMSCIQIGYTDGDYFIIRPLPNERRRKLFQAPKDSVFVADHIDTDPSSGSRFLVRIYFDGQLREILRREPVVTEYDPRLRTWYTQAQGFSQVSAVAPYLFYFLREIGTTVGYNPPGSEAVIAADVTLSQISDTLRKHLLTPHSELALITVEGMVLAYTRPEKIIVDQAGDQFRIARINELQSGVLEYIYKNDLLNPGPLKFSYNSEEWQGVVRTLNISDIEGRDMTLMMISPSTELLANAMSMIRRSLMITLIIILFTIPVASFIAAFISKALHRLAGEAVLIRRFDFLNPVSLRSNIKEVDELAQSMDLMKRTISRFLTLIRSLAGEQNFDAMLEQITAETLNVSGADGVLTYLVHEDAKSLVPGALFSREQGQMDIKGLRSVPLNAESELTRAISVEDMYHFHLYRGGEEELGELTGMFGADELQASVLPLKTRQDEVIGLLCLLNRVTGGEQKGSWEERLDFVRTFSGFAAVSLESRQLLAMQKRLMDSFMHLLAGAIDAKSPYTGGHCQRLPVIVKMMARAACEDEGLYKDFQLDEEGWEAVHLASWLHDCGKVTTPEYVVDKATKLETIYDRIHEVRTRFEVLKRDAEIRYLELVAGGGNQEELRLTLEQEWREIDDDFAFIAECNVGGEFMATEKIDRLELIAQRTWTRTLDDRIGISWEEEKRKKRVPKPELPVQENILADRLDHLIERNENERIAEDNPWGFKLDVPKYRYNHGELYNLKVTRGTLTAEERYKINDHIVQTIIMLEKLPFPKHLRRVPEFAGGHHETMDGKGYPKRLTGDQMSLTAKVMVIADIFEALTASDRPYKKAKKLSEAIKIMSFLKKDHHIDPYLFDLFLRSGVYRKYAEEYLAPEQIDDVDITEYLTSYSASM